MELIGALLLILALGLLTALFIARPFFGRAKRASMQLSGEEHRREHEHSALLAERDRTLNALQELDFDNALGKIPEEEYPTMRAELLARGASVLRRLDAFESGAMAGTVEERIEAAVAARRADAAQKAKTARVQAGSDSSDAAEPAEIAAPAAVGVNGGNAAAKKDSVEDLIASRKRVRQESAAGFCPNCGKPVLKSDKFCSKCGKTL